MWKNRSRGSVRGGSHANAFGLSVSRANDEEMNVMLDAGVQMGQGSFLMPSLDHATVSDAMHPGILSCEPDASGMEVAKLMATHHVHCVAVVGISHERPECFVWGIISDFDLIEAGIRPERESTARDLARQPIITVGPEMPLRNAAEAMLAHRGHPSRRHRRCGWAADRDPVDARCGRGARLGRGLTRGRSITVAAHVEHHWTVWSAANYWPVSVIAHDALLGRRLYGPGHARSPTSIDREPGDRISGSSPAQRAAQPRVEAP